uniref:Uncharacterized protein n=2 Tax=Parascaris univalens TaxID=6257 RepID=A0A915CJC3_PARUN
CRTVLPVFQSGVLQLQATHNRMLMHRLRTVFHQRSTPSRPLHSLSFRCNIRRQMHLLCSTHNQPHLLCSTHSHPHPQCSTHNQLHLQCSTRSRRYSIRNHRSRITSQLCSIRSRLYRIALLQQATATVHRDVDRLVVPRCKGSSAVASGQYSYVCYNVFLFAHKGCKLIVLWICSNTQFCTL